jgi:hypothetical protein
VFERLRAAAVWGAVCLVLLFSASLVGLLPVQVMRVDSDSMQPTLSPGDLLLVQHRPVSSSSATPETAASCVCGRSSPNASPGYSKLSKPVTRRCRRRLRTTRSHLRRR